MKSRFIEFTERYGALFGLVALCIALSLMTPHFLNMPNLLNVSLQSSINAILAVGLTFVIITGGIDLSVGSILALSGVIMADLLKKGIPLPQALLSCLAVGALCGLVNGILITKGKLPPFISTLAMMSMARGLALVYTGGRPISGFSSSFRFIANGKIWFLPMPIIIAGTVYIIAHLILTYTKLGRYTYAIGSNEEAAILSGIRVNKYKNFIYVLSGICSALGAIILTSRLNSAQPIAGIMYELDAIAAAVIGGTSLMGGEGYIAGTLIGALIMGVLRNGLNLLNVSSYLQQFIIGVVIAIAVLIDRIRRR